jgi:hypothetical protein
MKIVAFMILVGAYGMLYAEEAPSTLQLDGVSVVALCTPDWEVTEADRTQEGFDDFLDDYQYYWGQIQRRLRGRKDVNFVASYARNVMFKEEGVAPVSRKALSGYGFIVYVPGKTPKVFSGVATDIDVLCTLKELDPKIAVGVPCGPNNSLNGDGPDGPRR